MFLYTPSNYRPRSRNVVIFYISLLAFAAIVAMHRTTILQLFQPFKYVDSQARENTQVKTPRINQSPNEVSSLAAMLTERLELGNDAWPIPYSNSCHFESNTKPCQDKGCRPPNQTGKERVEDLLSDHFRLSKRQLDAIKSLGKSVPVSDVIIASAVSANHYEEMQAMFKALHEQVYPKLANFTMVLFDLGLKQNQLRMTEKNCRCRVVPFNFDLFPAHVRDLHCYSWKPLIIRAMAERATTLIVWQDASVRWKHGFEVIFERAALYGQQIVVTDHADRVTSNTVPEMFQYMKEDVCRYHGVPEIANAMALHRPDPLVVRTIMEPWARCALEASCMCPPNYSVWVIRHCVKPTGNHRCHRFDQSALTLLTAKLYGEERYKVEIPEEHKHVRVMRGDRIRAYFQD
ncbi:hypothetical protein EGW08_010194 [Elysia chlorotica]|uniref:Uncharacterized protein n=1 Tax=Elysia chlorotica TaxID=188477 RepID=A0A433TKF3_ELYCH|nr:hypothetical protein EGW08_010194 [Elysia chlorotica]